MNRFDATVEKFQVDIDKVKQRAITIENKVEKTEGIVRSINEDVLCLDKDLNDLEGIVENLDNQQHRNNIKIRVLKEKLEGKKLSDYLTDLFVS